MLSKNKYNYLMKALNYIGWCLLTAGYIWRLSEPCTIHTFIKYSTMQGYFLTWLFHLVSMLGKKSIILVSREQLFEFSLMLESVCCSIYWMVLHEDMVKSNLYPEAIIQLSIFYHSVPLILLLFQAYFSDIEIKFRWRITILYSFLIGFPINYGNNYLIQDILFTVGLFTPS